MYAIEITEHYDYDDYCQWEGRWELIEGIPLAMTPSPAIFHQAMATKIANELINSLGNCPQCMVMVEQDWKISEDTVLKPDVVMVCNEPGDKYLTKAPQIIAEVVSPSSARRDEVYKFEIYQQEQVPYYILLYPNDYKAKLYKLTKGKYQKQGDFFSESYRFDDLECTAAINFDAVFRQFRDKR